MRFIQGIADRDAVKCGSGTLQRIFASWQLVVRTRVVPPPETTAHTTNAVGSAHLVPHPANATSDQERYSFQIKTGQIQETIKLAAHSATTHIAIGAVIYWLWDGEPRAFLIPFCILVLLTEAIVFVGKILFERTEPTRRVVNLACRWAELVALIQGVTWGSMPLALLSGSDPDRRVLLVAIVAGLIGGVFVFGSISRITIIYTVPLVGGSFAALLIERKSSSSLVAILLAIYSLFVLTSVLRMNGLSTRRILNQLRVDDQRETIGPLLNDFEENTSDWLWETDDQGRLIHVSNRMAQVVRLPPTMLLHRAFHEIFDHELIGNETSQMEQQLEATIAGRVAFRELSVTFARDGIQHWWSLSGKPLFSSFGDFTGFRGVGSDVTKTVQAQERIAYLAKHDFLTGLTNRPLFLDLLSKTLKTHDAMRVAVFYVDLDDFKTANDTFGHAVGDEVLRRTAYRLRALVPADTVIARLGGDEFALFLPRTDEDDAIGLATSLIESLSEPCQCQGLAVALGASIGIAMGLADAPDSEAMLHRADLALYEAKARGKGKFVCFESSLERTIGARIALQADIKHAIARKEMMIHCRSADLFATVKNALAVSGLAPQRLELEITESVLLATTVAIKKNIAELKQIGVRFALDDFGTGFSSLSYLLKFPVDKIKIDQCFVRELPMRLECEAVVDAVY